MDSEFMSKIEEYVLKETEQAREKMLVTLRWKLEGMEKNLTKKMIILE